MGSLAGQARSNLASSIVPKETSSNKFVFAINKDFSYNLGRDWIYMVMMSLGIGLSSLLLWPVWVE